MPHKIKFNLILIILIFGVQLAMAQNSGTETPFYKEWYFASFEDDMGILQLSIEEADSMFDVAYADIIDGYETDDLYYRTLYWQSAKKRLQIIYGILVNGEDASERMRQQLQRKGYCSELISDLDEIHLKFKKNRLIIDQLFQSSWSLKSSNDYVQWQKPHALHYFATSRELHLIAEHYLKNLDFCGTE